MALAIAEFGAARSAIPVGRKNERPPWLFALFAAVLLQYLCLTYTTWRGAALTTFLILFTNGLITAAAFGFIRVCYRARRPTNLSLIVAVLLVLAIPIAYVRGYGRGGFGQGFKRAFVEDPLSALGAFRSYHAWTGIVNPIRVTIQFAYDSRVTSMLFLGAPVSVDLAFGSLGALACGLRRRRRGGLSA